MPEPIGGVQPFAELARGGATVVYKGYRRADGRLVLLKTVRPEGSEDEDLVARFEEEARLAAQVIHPNVVAVHDAGREGAAAFLVTEFVEGLDLGALIEQGPLPPALAAYVLHEAAQGLAAVHAQGILHRDLKPANILVSAEGAVKLTDFGLASLAPSGAATPTAVDLEVRGTLGYLAPEIVRGDPPTPRADLFSLGAILAETLTGRPAFVRDAAGATLDAVLHYDPAPPLAADPRVPTALADLAADLLKKDPQDRPPRATSVVDALASIRAHYPAEADGLAAYLHDPESYVPVEPSPVAALANGTAGRATPEPPETLAPSRRRIGWGVAAGILALVLIGIVGVSLVSERRAGPLEDPVRDARTDAPGDSAENTAIGSRDSLGKVSARAVSGLPDAEPEPPPEPVAAVTGDAEVPSSFTEDTAQAVELLAPELPSRVDSGAAGLDSGRGGSGAEATAVPGTLIVVADPWARVRVDGADVGTTPLGALSLPPGRYTVGFENPDFPPHSVDVDVASGGEERLAVSLWDLVGRVTLVVSPWAEVAVNGTLWDTVPPQERPLVLPPGTHRLSFTHPAFGTREETLRIAAGESRTLRINLSEMP